MIAKNPNTQPSTTATVQATAGPASDPAQSEIDAILASLARIPIILGSAGVPAAPLTIEQRRAQPKMKTGADNQIPLVLDLADKYGLVIPGGGTAEARADLERATLLGPLLTCLAAMAALVSDEILQGKGRAWETTRLAYAMLVPLVRRFPALQIELDAMASFMARIHKDAPTVLRQAEARTLSKSRATLKAKKGKTATAAPAPGATTTSNGTNGGSHA